MPLKGEGKEISSKDLTKENEGGKIMPIKQVGIIGDMEVHGNVHIK